ncbi:MAG: prepilin-type N-terminal cleavage/methylation domain-containing protein [Actinobacteria bacterium]|nr:prepilin-type N-terminal cleavage/methylation domain-containing protein [Actinomycetota bacterium]
MRRKKRLRLMNEEGLTLIELMVAMMIFLVVSSGIAGSLTTGLVANVHARISTMGKDAAQAQMEEMRSRTYFVPYSTNPDVGTTSDFDLLDRYYPNVNLNTTTDYQGWSGQYFSGSAAHYTKVSPPDSHGIVLTVETWFVDYNRNVVVPPINYNSKSTGNDIPPSGLVQVKVTASWTDRAGPSSYTLESLISATAQSPLGSGNSGENGGCSDSSDSHVNVIGGIMNASTGTADPYTSFVSGKFGDAHASANYSCPISGLASATGGDVSVVGGSTYTGADVSVSAPPAEQKSVGPINTEPSGIWPQPAIGNSKAQAEAQSENNGYQVEAEGEANVGSLTLRLSQVGDTPTQTLNNYRQWDFINPTVTVNGAGTGDDGEDIEAEIYQANGSTEARANFAYKQINILPLQNWPAASSTPSATQGLIFLRDFQSQAHSQAGGSPGNASNSLTYQGTLGMFNPNKTGCTSTSGGDACYDLYSISPSNPIQNISLSNPNYALQQELITEWHSFTAADINNAMYVKPDGTHTTINIDALVKISGKYGQEVNWKNANNAITLVSQQGLQQIWVGAYDISLVQNA